MHISGLDWKRDFRRQDPEKLALMFRAVSASVSQHRYDALTFHCLSSSLRLLQAAGDFPVLKNYANQWATGVIARQYMQHIRRQARDRGIIARRVRYNRGGDKENVIMSDE